MGISFDFGVGVRHSGTKFTSVRHEYSFTDQTVTSSAAISATGVLGAFEIGNVDINFNPTALSPESTSFGGGVAAVKVDRYQGVGGGITVNPDELELTGRVGFGSNSHNVYAYGTVGIGSTDWTQSESYADIKTVDSNGIITREIHTIIGRDGDDILIHQRVVSSDGTRFQQTVGVHKDAASGYFDEQRARDASDQIGPGAPSQSEPDLAPPPPPPPSGSDDSGDPSDPPETRQPIRVQLGMETVITLHRAEDRPLQ